MSADDAPPPPPEGWSPVATPPPPSGGGGITRLWRSDGGRRLVVILTLVNTILASIVAGLQVAASQRADDANRDSQRYAVLTTGALVSAGDRSKFDMGVLTDIQRYEMESLVYKMTALDLTQKGDTAAARELTELAKVSDARAARLRELSVFYADKRYAPATEQDFPDLEAYSRDSGLPGQELLDKQNAAADDYSYWDGKSSAYVGVLTVLALAFFLLGVAQVSRRMRPFLGLTSSALTLLLILWTVVITVG